jgi:pimeloyl-ACP methyl ester carboxylesterase
VAPSSDVRSTPKEVLSVSGRSLRRFVVVIVSMSMAIGIAPVVGAAVPQGPKNEIGVPYVQQCPGEPGVQCGRIRVPLFWAEPNGETIWVHFRIYPKTDPSATEAPPLVGFAGGPGASSINGANSWLTILGPLRASTALIVMDQRGTGRSAPIDCRELQNDIGEFVDQAAACAARLGEAANAFGNAAASADLKAILDGLEIDQVSLHGTSAGSFLAGSFASHYPEKVHAAVFDGAYDDTFDPFAYDGFLALRETWTKLCERAGTCEGILEDIGWLADQLASEPLTGVGFDYVGKRHQVTITPTFLAEMVYDGTFGIGRMLRDLPAAIDAYRAGDPAPLLRLGAEVTYGNAAGGSPRWYSYGLYMAVYCHDNPLVFDRDADFSTRRAQLEAAIDAFAPDAFRPFANDVYLHHRYQYELVFGCLEWPAPRFDDPAFVDGDYDDLPALVLNGEFDYTTPPANAMAVAERFPNSTYVELANGKHVVSRGDQLNCAVAIARRFLASLDAGDTSCATATPDVKVVPAFPASLDEAPEATPSAGDASTPAERRAAWAAAWTVGDALMRQSAGRGLRGGSYSSSGSTVTLSGARFVDGVPVSGSARYDRASLTVIAQVSVSAPGVNGTFVISFPTGVPFAEATIAGSIGGRTIALTTPAPWATRA